MTFHFLMMLLHFFYGADLVTDLSIVHCTDLVCQSGPGSWPSLVYAQSAVYPMAHSAAQVLALLLEQYHVVILADNKELFLYCWTSRLHV